MSLLQSVDKRTQLVGENRLEILMFRLKGRGQFAINVFKIQEILRIPKLTLLPKRHPVVCGVVHLRGKTLPVIDLSSAIGGPKQEIDKSSTIIVTEYRRSVQAFLVSCVERIINLAWSDILPPPPGTGRTHFLTAITRIDQQIVEIVDVEKVLNKVTPFDDKISDEFLNCDILARAKGAKVLVVDDSHVAIHQVIDTLSAIGLEYIVANNGQEGLDILLNLINGSEVPITDQILMVITDAEMPVMDGYRLTAEIRSHPKLCDLHVVLHTSLSGNFNIAMTKKVGCDGFLSKFQPDELCAAVRSRVEMLPA